MKKYICSLCGYEYDSRYGDEENGIGSDISIEELPVDWVCPSCAASKDDFEAVEIEE